MRLDNVYVYLSIFMFVLDTRNHRFVVLPSSVKSVDDRLMVGRWSVDGRLVDGWLVDGRLVVVGWLMVGWLMVG